MLNLDVHRTEYLDTKLIQRVIVALADTDGPPHIATFRQSRHTLFLGLAPKSLFLSLVLQLKQKPLLGQCLYRVHPAKVQKKQLLFLYLGNYS